MLHWSQGAFISALGLSLLHSLWQGAVVGALGLALNVRLKHAAPDVRCGAFFLLLLTIFAVWLGTFCCLYDAQTRPAVFAGGGPTGSSVVQSLLAAPHPPTGGTPSVSMLRSLSPILVALWALGVCVLSLRHLGGFLLLSRLSRAAIAPCPPAWEACARRLAVRMGIRRKIRLRCSTRIDVPFASGLFKASILLPLSVMTGLAPEQAEALIAHELAHFARHDVLLNLIQVCMETVLFYHTAVRWLSVQIRTAREQHCDDLAIQVIGDRALYARALFSLEEARASIPQLALGAKGDTSDMTNTHLIRRIRRVLGAGGPERRDPWAKGALALGAAAIGLAALLPVHAYSPSTDPGTAASNPSTARTVTTTVRSKILLNIDGDKIELNGTDLTPDTLIKVNGKEGRFGDLTQTQQQQLQQALKVLPSLDIQSLMNDAATNGVKGSAVRVFSTAKILLNINGDKIEIGTTDPTADTPVTVNGTKGRFGDLTRTQQQQLCAQLHAVHLHVTTASGSLPSDVIGQVNDAIQGLGLPDDVKLQVIEGVKAQTGDPSGSPAIKP